MKKETRNTILAIGAMLILAFANQEFTDRANAKRTICSVKQNIKWSREHDPRFKYLKEDATKRKQIDTYFLRRS